MNESAASRLVGTTAAIALVPLLGAVGGIVPGALSIAITALTRSGGYFPAPKPSVALLLQSLSVGAVSGAALGILFSPLGYCSAVFFYPLRQWLRFCPLPLIGTTIAGAFAALGGPLLSLVCCLAGYISTSVVAWRLLKAEAEGGPA
jgi:hypothetical protein